MIMGYSYDLDGRLVVMPGFSLADGFLKIMANTRFFFFAIPKRKSSFIKIPFIHAASTKLSKYSLCVAVANGFHEDVWVTRTCRGARARERAVQQRLQREGEKRRGGNGGRLRQGPKHTYQAAQTACRARTTTATTPTPHARYDP
ncbi:hypothetical protein K438DRAFT_1930749 [Mycena galopus ATCC 62051]|nr:hypothetical protein K438DRAFT_1930749 [Mycena galopus ATCC 62051]